MGSSIRERALRGDPTPRLRSSFYESSYSRGDGEAPAYRTADAELSPLWNGRLLVHLEWALGPVRLAAELGRMWNQYPDFPSLPTRHARIGGLGLDAEL
ncbi:MAG: hypothetical protein HY791_14350 [Deltaproteobacteria bacterium]|nr:hypothetical protein [Deltaproteobacteria bacterium]